MSNGRVLMLASVASTIQQFNMANIELLKELGYEVDVACNFEEGNNCSDKSIYLLKEQFAKTGVRYFQIDFSRSAKKLTRHITAYKQTSALLRENKYVFLHCHSPICSAIVRLANHKSSTQAIYTAHGFHFYKGAPLKNWLLYYPVEKLCAKYTDILITINKEDYSLAQKKMKARQVLYIPGVGVDTERFSYCTVNAEEKRSELGIQDDVFILLSVGELNGNKNHEVILKALKVLGNAKIHYLIAGKGELEKYLYDYSENLGLSRQVHILGYRKDIAELCKSADVFCFPSHREGLGIAALEAMAAGLPIVTSDIRGINEYSVNGETGFSCDPDDVSGFVNAINSLYNDATLRMTMGNRNTRIVKGFDINVVNNEMKAIYSLINAH